MNGRSAQAASLLGPSFSADEVEAFLRSVGASYRRHPPSPISCPRSPQSLVDGKVVGWFHGRMEFGPRALGARSILGDARSKTMQATMNVKIKFRESFRPFAPCVLREHAHEWFGVRPGRGFALHAPGGPRARTASRGGGRCRRGRRRRTIRICDAALSVVRSTVPAITHVDLQRALQTVDEQHGRFQRLLQAFYAKTGCPILVNTSFNLSWEPIVMTPQQAYHTFMQSEMDVLVLEDCVLRKEEQAARDSSVGPIRRTARSMRRTPGRIQKPAIRSW